MKIRFGANDVIDTQNPGAPENYEEVENAALDTQDTLDDGSTSYEDQTQLNLLKRFVKGFLSALADGSAGPELRTKIGYSVTRIYEQFDDLVQSESDTSGWGEIAGALEFDPKQEEGE